MKYSLLPFSFETLPLPTKRPQNPAKLLISLNSQLSSLTNSHQHSRALLLSTQIHSSPFISPDHFTLSSAFKSCAHLRAHILGSQLHSLAVRTGLVSFSHVANSLLSFYSKTHAPDVARKLFDSIAYPDGYSYTTMLSAYAKSGQFERALQLFDEMPETSTPVWNAMITGYIDHGYRGCAFGFFVRMNRLGIGFDRYTFASVLSICDSVEFVGFGRQVHSLVIRSGSVELSVTVVNALVTMYLDCEAVEEGVSVFREAKIRDVITYNGMIAGFVRWEREEDALLVFKELIGEACLIPTELTYVSIMTACASKEISEQVHGQVIKVGLEDSLLVCNSAVAMYSDSANLISARRVFDMIYDKDVVSWNSMVSGYSQQNLHESAIKLYCEMLNEGTEPDEFTYGSLIACLPAAKHAEMVHAIVVQNGLIAFIEVCNSLISTYAKCEDMGSTQRIFIETSFKNLISWNSIISGYMLNGLPMAGLQSFSNLLNSGNKPNSYTLSTVLSTCATISTLRFGEQIHSYILKSGSDCEIALGNSLITMYAKCGDLDSSSKVFRGMSQRDLVSWNAIISAYSQNGDGHEVVHYFRVLQKEEILLDHATFTTVLSACSHAGLVEEGHLIFSSMIKDYDIEPQLDHYSCMIDLLSRAGHLNEAESLIGSMPYGANSHIWWAVLSACSTYGNARLGRTAAGFLLEMEPENTAVYVLLSNINAAQGNWEEASSIREQMRNKGVVKKPGYSWI
ncbi:uncharacterized protein A4U43_C07F38880 [Asparagus officinalis]|uniref:Pentacotripeptide-repeat region of PRORP domain-containing protein n=1 Tax=Asparagus officinalis TaxID=4686 RepID=A0A5P1EIQ0_ASPOF|nr:pentatricopeptide repeat-containing protein At3g49740 [Asparagus officinalis]XP_020273809.1 pentatricopeptide repeat-containing protein At3g49740 [Asparagus officinalis]XP_020273810.1 pentatricopeptide repeat-containing protein At3g49740 [Asparagus officinalis]XP_020273811.1 pentatricopeptide repeat-containing protein At3g49740 [Asparagus officinalis]XP_020273813.1 pentatricopeptide repeat-containing protein At3g49740 [Asparagus officinalis]ONK65613.1 uncharacterized protein A4U43_C07F38880